MINNLYDDDPENGPEQGAGDSMPPEEENNQDNEVAQAQESSASRSKKSWSKKTTDAVKKAVKNWKGKSSVIAALGPILLWIFVALVILIVIIGLVMFLITMPGMVLEQLKALAKEMGDAVASWFGADVTTQVDDVEIYDTLSYLEQMGYDLKGFGFLTDYVGTSKDGVERDENDVIINAESDFIMNYLISDNYVYTIKNFNIVNNKGGLLGILSGLGQHLASFFTGGNSNQYWSRGMLDIWHDTGVVGEKSSDYYSTMERGYIKVDTKAKALEIKRGWFNNPMRFNLDGWTGRYGMPIDFLLSVHLATMMPDLAYDMATTFETRIELLLHKNSGDVDGAYKTDDGRYLKYSEIKAYASSGWFDGWRISKEEGKKIMTDYNITSPDYCEGTKVNSEEGEITKKCSEVPISEADECCGNCREFLQKIYDEIKDVHDGDFSMYTPYISLVENHWYRDVYFIETDKQFVTYDYEYEAMMKERWTLYETNDEGEYKLYELKEDGSIGSEFYGTEEDAKNQNKTVIKKAVTDTIQSMGEDLNWDNSNGFWTAYVENAEKSSTGWEQVYPNIDESEKDYEIRSRIYSDVTIKNSIIQTGEGQRTETNNDIKKMFLNNYYFRYDGSQNVAEIITALREKIGEISEKGESYGAIKEELLNNSYDLDFSNPKYNSSAESGSYKLSDYVGKVALNEDSLNAFSMLENTHTLDSDYIYRDFKELIVELGYFTKEELTDETPRLLQWLIPDIGSGGFPRRELDKREDEFGTTIHSKNDYDANNKNVLRAMYEKASQDKESGAVNENIDAGDKLSEETVSGITNVSEVKNPVGTINDFSLRDKINASADISKVVSGMGSNFERIAQTGDGYDYKVKCGSVEFTHYYQFKGTYAEKEFTWSGETKTIHRAGCGPTSCVNVLTGYGQDVNPTDNIVGINFDATIFGVKDFMEQYGVTGESFAGIPDSEYKSRIEQAFSEGKPIITLMHQDKTGDSFWTDGGHFVAMVGQDNNGNIITLDSGTSSADRHTYTGGVDGLLSTIDALWVADEAPDGMASGSNFEGYKGNEAVVSPVTGILLEYGTYTDAEEDINSLTKEEERVNTDLKHGVNAENSIVTKEDGTLEVKPKEGEQESASEIVHDKVGYAKILVLDAENYQRLESTTQNSFASDSLVKIKKVNTSADVNTSNTSYNTDKAKAGFAEKVQSEEDIEDWTNIDKTIYGYKEFAETYEKYGIAGYTVYIDGFICELPDEELTENEGEDEGDDISEKIPNGEKLTLDSFKKITDGDLQGKDPLEEDEALDSKYEKDADYKMASKKATDKLNAESSIKEQANSSIYSSSAAVTTEDNIDLTGIYIKEGTVIGRTMTDKELIENVRKEKNRPYEYYRPDDEGGEGEDEEENHDKVMGNYIRVMMRDLEKTVVENIEDYMKLDDVGSTSVTADDVIKFMAGVLTAECGPTSEQGQAAAAWVIKNRLDSGRFGATLEEILVAPMQFTVVATDPSECTGGYVTKGETISLEVNGTTYYVNAPSDLSIKIAKSVISGSSEYKNEIGDRCYWKSAETNVDASKDPIQIPPGTGNKYHY